MDSYSSDMIIATNLTEDELIDNLRDIHKKNNGHEKYEANYDLIIYKNGRLIHKPELFEVINGSAETMTNANELADAFEIDEANRVQIENILNRVYFIK